MRSFGIFLTAFLAINAAVAQDACPEYGRLMKEADSFFTQGHYLQALYKYNSAKTCSPSKRPDIDKKINRLFQRIENERKKAQTEESQVRSMYTRLKIAEAAKYTADSNRIVDRYKAKNTELFNRIPEEELASLLDYVVQLNAEGKGSLGDTVVSSYSLYNLAVQDGNYFAEALEYDSRNIDVPKLWRDQKEPISYFQVIALDTHYYAAWTKIRDAINLLPPLSNARYGQKFAAELNLLFDRRNNAARAYWMPDTVREIPSGMFARPCSDNRNFVWGYSDYDDYNEVKVHYFDLSLDNFSLATDSLVALSDTGRFFSVMAAAGNYRYKVGKEIDYALKKNRAEYRTEVYALPTVMKLIDGRGEMVEDFSPQSAFFFSPDAGYLATWKDDSVLLLYNVNSRKFIPLPHASPARTESFSSDSKSVAYYNEATGIIYISDMEGRLLNQIPGKRTGLAGITNIDFTGNSNFLKINNADSICLFDLKNKAPVLLFNSLFVKDIVVAPNSRELLITCNTKYTNSEGNHTGFLTFLTDAELNIKAKLYSECENYFFTPGGEFIVGYGPNSIMRWAAGGPRPAPNSSRSCLATSELVNHECFPYDRLLSLDDARQIEIAARKYRTIADKQTDPILSGLYYRHCRDLFARLARGNLQNIRREAAPNFYDWINYMDTRLGYRNFNEQLSRQKVAVDMFDRLVNSGDSVYPEQLYNAANGSLFLGDLYDTLHQYGFAYRDQVIKELALRQRVFAMDPDNWFNGYYFTNALARFFRVSDSIAWKDLVDRRYMDRLDLMKGVTMYFGEKINVLPDSLGVRQLYVSSLVELAPTYLYLYVSQPTGYPNALDSALYFADQGLSVATSRIDSAKLMIVKARVYLIQPDGLQNATGLYQLVREKFPEITTEQMLKQLALLREAGTVNEANIQAVEKILSIPQATNDLHPVNNNGHEIH